MKQTKKKLKGSCYCCCCQAFYNFLYFILILFILLTCRRCVPTFQLVSRYESVGLGFYSSLPFLFLRISQRLRLTPQHKHATAATAAQQRQQTIVVNLYATNTPLQLTAL